MTLDKIAKSIQTPLIAAGLALTLGACSINQVEDTVKRVAAPVAAAELGVNGHPVAAAGVAAVGQAYVDKENAKETGEAVGKAIRGREIYDCTTPLGNHYKVYINHHGQYIPFVDEKIALKCDKVVPYN